MKPFKLAIGVMASLPLFTQLFLLLSPLQRNAYGYLFAAAGLSIILALLLFVIGRFAFASLHHSITSRNDH